MKGSVFLAASSLLVATFAVVAAPARATSECEGLRVCVPVAGPWVIVPPGRGASRPRVEFQLSCPRRYVVGGLDAELSDRSLDVSFVGKLGSPVNPGITTARAVVFVATHAGGGTRSASFRPHVGCIPASGAGSRVPTSASRAAVFPPGQPTMRRVRTARVRTGDHTVVQGCSGGERLVGAAHAVGFYTRRPPSASLTASVTSSRSLRGGRVVVRVHGDAELGGVRAVVQVQAICARVP
jgi:hypothetical protein